jgi:hypothetical protein
MPDDDSKVRQLPARSIIGVAGGLVDRSTVTLVLTGEMLVPADVTAMLGVEPTDAWERGSRQGPRSPPRKHGGWLYRIEGREGQDPDQLVRALLLRFPEPTEIWVELSRRYTVAIWVGLFAKNWNRGFSMSPTTVRMIAATAAAVELDLYFEGDVE